MQLKVVGGDVLKEIITEDMLLQIVTKIRLQGIVTKTRLWDVVNEGMVWDAVLKAVKMVFQRQSALPIHHKHLLMDGDTISMFIPPQATLPLVRSIIM